MRPNLIHLLLALSLVLNPVAVLAAGYHNHAAVSQQGMEQSTDHAALFTTNPHSEPQQADVACDMPCCADSDCFENGFCTLQYNPVALIPYVPPKAPGGEFSDWRFFTDRVSERAIPPDIPPPIGS